MYYKIKSNILFRKYKDYGYITDNAMFGYRYLNNMSSLPGEEYVSESGAVMLSMLRKKPHHIDDIVNKLMQIFVGVGYNELKQDTIEFYNAFVDLGFLSSGDTYDDCDKNVTNNSNTVASSIVSTISTNDCSSKIFNQSDFLRSLHIEIANECNERCVHCYIPHEYKTNAIDSNLFYSILDEGTDMNIIHVTLSGGEPLLHKDFPSFLKKCREKDLSVNVLTNLTLLTDEILSEMVLNPLLSVQTSLYSMDPEIHDSITKVKGSFKKTTNSIKRIMDAGIPLQISCPVMKQNKDTFNDVVCWGKKHNLAVAVDYVIFASYDHSKCNLSNRLSLPEIEEAFNKQISNDYIHSVKEQAKEKENQANQDSICSICRYYICISAEGNVFPCIGWQNNIIGNLNKQTLKSIWETSDKIKELRKVKREQFPKCVECKDRGYCTVCMMSNSNENANGDAFKINDFHCRVADLIHSKVDNYDKLN